ncbi:MAG TPA: HepT-like ribonuclease domain-containing protein [Saccharospirillum sp.]|nr:HepT-like ribonuclease domain-containing protein [Saccharospirillum sp.]
MIKTWEPYAYHILENIRKIHRITERGSILDDEILYDAALRNLQTLSEATQRLPEDFKAEHPNIPWREISGFRNILVHNYLGDIDTRTIQQVIERYLGPLERAVNEMVAKH